MEVEMVAPVFRSLPAGRWKGIQEVEVGGEDVEWLSTRSLDATQISIASSRSACWGKHLI